VLAVPGAFGADARLFGVAYLIVRLLRFVLSWIVARGDFVRRGVLIRFAPTAFIGASLILLAGFLEGRVRIVFWLVALAIDYLGPIVIGIGSGWHVAATHFAETTREEDRAHRRHGHPALARRIWRTRETATTAPARPGRGAACGESRPPAAKRALSRSLERSARVECSARWERDDLGLRSRASGRDPCQDLFYSANG
jgi:low temperature requirement A protein (LtrA)